MAIKKETAEAREVRHAMMRKLAEEAMNDPLFVADMREVMHDFRFVDAENWPAYEEDSDSEADC